MAVQDRVPPKGSKVWTTLLTSQKYLSGVLTLEYSLRQTQTKYPFVVLYTENVGSEIHNALDSRNIHKLRVKQLLPRDHRREYNKGDARFLDTWTKLQPFSLYEYFDRLVLMDADMLVLQNMDELMDIQLDGKSKVFAAAHACVCNPYKISHYPKDWIKENCAYTNYKPTTIEEAGFSVTDSTILGPSCHTGLKHCNGGLYVIVPSKEVFQQIEDTLNNPELTDTYYFPDQGLVSDVFEGKWVPLSYKYNALKTLKSIHSDFWDFNEVKNIHYILSTKPWDTVENDDTDTFKYWFDFNHRRKIDDAKNGVTDGF